MTTSTQMMSLFQGYEQQPLVSFEQAIQPLVAYCS